MVEPGNISRRQFSLLLGSFLVLGVLIGASFTKFGANADTTNPAPSGTGAYVAPTYVITTTLVPGSFGAYCDANPKYGNGDGKLDSAEYDACMAAPSVVPETAPPAVTTVENPNPVETGTGTGTGTGSDDTPTATLASHDSYESCVAAYTSYYTQLGTDPTPYLGSIESGCASAYPNADDTPEVAATESSATTVNTSSAGTTSVTASSANTSSANTSSANAISDSEEQAVTIAIAQQASAQKVANLPLDKEAADRLEARADAAAAAEEAEKPTGIAAFFQAIADFFRNLFS